jgi:thioredoxin-disulfide reductase
MIEIYSIIPLYKQTVDRGHIQNEITAMIQGFLMKLVPKRISLFAILSGLACILSCCLPTRFIFSNREEYDWQRVETMKNVGPIVIIGAGPAGYSAAIYAARERIPTYVIAGYEPGGLLTKTTHVENYPGHISILGPDLMNIMRKQAEKAGAIIIEDSATALNLNSWPFVVQTENGHVLNALSVIFATGAKPRKLGIPGEELYWSVGVSSCAICDAPFFKGEDVVVIGGGDSAAEEATQLAPHVRSVTILVRSDKMRASQAMQDQLKGYPNIVVEYNVEPQEIVGDGIKVTGIKLLNKKTNQIVTKNISGVFLAIGHEPNSDLVRSALKTNPAGYIEVIGRSQATSVEGVFAAGEVEDHEYRQAVVEAGRGVVAALDSIGFLKKKVGWNTARAERLQIQGQLFSVNRTSLVDSKVSEINSLEEFEVIKQNEWVILDFYTDTCPSCLQMMPAFEEVAQEYKSKMAFAKVNADKVPALTQKLFVHRVPCLLVFNKGSLVARFSNVMTKKELSLFVQQFLNH